MKSKTEIASELLKVIQSLSLSPPEVKHLTLEWIKAYPFLLEDFGWDIQIRARVENIVAEVEKLQALLYKADLEEDISFENEAETSDEKALISEPVLQIAETETPPPNDAPPVEETSPTVVEPPVEPEAPVADALSVMPPTPDEPESLPQKGYSKYGKKLGRPPKKRPEAIKEEPKPRKTTPKTKPTAPAPKPAPEPEPEPQPLTAEELLEQLKYGKEYAYDLLYLVNTVYVRSPFKLRDEAGVSPVGIVIPYMLQDEPYEIVVYYTDETAAIPLNTARKYAKNKLLPYKDVSWRVKVATDDAHIRPVLAEINEIFKKMGGDPIKGNYIDGRGTYYDPKADLQRKIRYVCDIPLAKKEQSE